MATSKPTKSLFSKSDLYHLADKIVDMYDRLNLVYKFAVMGNDQTMMKAYNGMLVELELLIRVYGLREMTKID
jgi:hypothetical protein